MIQLYIKISIAISKIDRLMLEIKIPTADAYLKINQSLDEIN